MTLVLALIFKIAGFVIVGISIMYIIVASIRKKRIRIGCLIFILAILCFVLSTYFERQHLFYG